MVEVPKPKPTAVPSKGNVTVTNLRRSTRTNVTKRRTSTEEVPLMPTQPTKKRKTAPAAEEKKKKVKKVKRKKTSGVLNSTKPTANKKT